MNYTRRKLMTLMSALLLTLFVGCANQSVPETADALTIQQSCQRAITPNSTEFARVKIQGITYVYTFTTNGQGWPVTASFAVNDNRASNAPSKFDGQCTGDVGRIGGAGYQGGHIAANRFGAPSRRINLFPQVANYNTGSFRTIEANIANTAKRLGNNESILVKIQLVYNGSIVPESLNINLQILTSASASGSSGIAGPQRQWNYDNRFGYGPQNTATKNQIKTWLSNQ